MAKILTLPELVWIVQQFNVDAGEQERSYVLAETNRLAEKVAKLLDVCYDMPTWDDPTAEDSQPMVGFYPKRPADPCPAHLQHVDPAGTWEPAGDKLTWE
jgi:hypothetical protein